MRPTSLCLHALRALAYLARHGAGFVTAEAIARAEGLSRDFLVQALQPLVPQVVLSSRVPGSGYRLARPARMITVLEVVEAVDGPVRGEVPRFGGDARLDDRLQEVWDRAAEVVRRRLRKVSLADLATEGG